MTDSARHIPIAARMPRRRYLIVLSILAVLAVVLTYLALTDNPRIWPYRNTLQYHLLRRLGGLTTLQPAESGTLAGTVRDTAGRPIPYARVLVAGRDGTPWSAEANARGAYRMQDVPAASYVPMAGAFGFEDVAIRRGGLLRTRVVAGEVTSLDITLAPATGRPVAPAENFRLDPVQTLKIDAPLPAIAEERQVRFEVAGRPNQATFYYTPAGGKPSLPTLLTVYPGPADQWKQVSLPLAQAGYAVIAVGPVYALDLEPDVDDLLRLIDALDAGRFPRADPRRVAALGGSYSSLHVFRLVQRDQESLDAILLLGPPTDLFELRRQFEAGTLFPPFGLDQALIALGLPDRSPEPYWRYSVRYHARTLNVPVMLIHSKADEVVPFTQSELLARELKRLGKRHELHILEEMGHYLLEPERTPAIDDLFRTTVGFFERELAR